MLGSGVPVSAGCAVCGDAVLSSVAAAVGGAVANVVGFVEGKSDCIALRFGAGTTGGGTAVGNPDGFGDGVAVGLAAGWVKSTAK